MPIFEIPHEKWSAELNTFTTAHEGWLVSLDVFGPDVGAQPEITCLPLLGISADRVNHDGDIAISVALSATDHFTHVVRGVGRIFIERTHNGATAALMIESKDGTRTVLQLRAKSALERSAAR
jgi:hypothetical protein